MHKRILIVFIASASGRQKKETMIEYLLYSSHFLLFIVMISYHKSNLNLF